MSVAESIEDWLTRTSEEDDFREAALNRAARCGRDAAECDREARIWADKGREDRASDCKRLARMFRDCEYTWKRVAAKAVST